MLLTIDDGEVVLERWPIVNYIGDRTEKSIAREPSVAYARVLGAKLA